MKIAMMILLMAAYLQAASKDASTRLGEWYIAADSTLWVYGEDEDEARQVCRDPDRANGLRQCSSEKWLKIAGSPAEENSVMFGIRSDSSLWAWGKNRMGVLGLGHSNQVSEFTRVGMDKWIDLSVHENATAAVKENGELWVWGSHAFPLSINSNTPMNLNTTQWEKVHLYSGGLFAIHQDGTLWGMGENGFGQLLTGDTLDQSTLVQISDLSWSEISGGTTPIGIRSDSTLWWWGKNYEGMVDTSQQVGIVIGEAKLLDVSDYSYQSFSGAVKVMANDSNFWVVDRERSAFGWGSKKAFSWSEFDAQDPTYAEVRNGVIGLSVHGKGGHLVREDGSVWGIGALGYTKSQPPKSWNQLEVDGFHQYGSTVQGMILGQNFVTTQNSYLFFNSLNNSVTGVGLDSLNVIRSDTPGDTWTSDLHSSIVKEFGPFQLFAGRTGSYLFLINQDSILFGKGRSYFGELGFKDNYLVDSIYLAKVGSGVDSLLGKKWIFAYSGNQVSLGIDANQDLFSWGSRSSGALGVETEESTIFPREILRGQFIETCVGDSYGLALEETGTLWLWGNNEAFNTDSFTIAVLPQKMENAESHDFVKIECDQNSAILRTKKGELYSFGSSFLSSSNQMFEALNNPVPAKSFLPFFDSLIVFLGEDERVYGMGKNRFNILSENETQDTDLQWMEIFPESAVRIFGTSSTLFVQNKMNQIMTKGKTDHDLRGMNYRTDSLPKISPLHPMIDYVEGQVCDPVVINGADAVGWIDLKKCIPGLISNSYQVNDPINSWMAFDSWSRQDSIKLMVVKPGLPTEEKFEFVLYPFGSQRYTTFSVEVKYFPSDTSIILNEHFYSPYSIPYGDTLEVPLDLINPHDYAYFYEMFSNDTLNTWIDSGDVFHWAPKNREQDFRSGLWLEVKPIVDGDTLWSNVEFLQLHAYHPDTTQIVDTLSMVKIQNTLEIGAQWQMHQKSQVLLYDFQGRSLGIYERGSLQKSLRGLKAGSYFLFDPKTKNVEKFLISE